MKNQLLSFQRFHLFISVVSCGFENSGMCGWTQDASDQFDWSKGTGNTTSVYTGPKWDKTYETGFGKCV